MVKKLKTLMKVGLLVSLFMVFSLQMAYKVASSPVRGDSLLRIEAHQANGAAVDVSVPLSLLDSVFDVMPGEIRRLCNELQLTPETIVAELQKMDGEDIVCVTGRDHIRVYLAPTTAETRRDLGYVKVHVKEPGGHGNEINVCVPRGLVSLASGIVKQLGLVDKYVDLPPEIEELTRLHPSETVRESR